MPRVAYLMLCVALWAAPSAQAQIAQAAAPESGAHADPSGIPTEPGTDDATAPPADGAQAPAALEALRRRPVAPDAKGRWRHGRAARHASLWGGWTRVSTAGRAKNAFGGALRQRGRADIQLGWLSTRYRDFALIGYGSAGLEAGLAGDLAMGVRFPIAEVHGPIARLGMRGHLLGNDRFYTSAFELPQLQIGYQWLDEHLHLELLARAGYVLTGRYQPGDARRNLNGSGDVGSIAVVGVGPLHVEIAYARIFEKSAAALHQLDAEACFAEGMLAICLAARHTRGDAAVDGTVARTRLTYLGLSLGIGDAERR